MESEESWAMKRSRGGIWDNSSIVQERERARVSAGVVPEARGPAMGA